MPHAASASSIPPPTERRHRRALGLLLAVYSVNFMDRQLLAVLAPSIQRELGLSDTQVGLLGGLAFAIFYAALGIPLARVADRASRHRLILLSLVAFSVMTALCGLATGFLTLLAARVGVAVGEAGTNPASHSLIADLYPAARRASAMGVYAIGPHLGLLAAFLLGGALDQALGWRWAFVVPALVGLLLAAAFARGFAEPDRPGPPAGALTATPVAVTVRGLLRDPVLRHVVAGVALASAVGYGILVWLPMFLARSHGLVGGRAGLLLALLVGASGALGNWVGGRAVDRLRRLDLRWCVVLPALALAAAALLWLAALATDATRVALVLIALPNLLGTIYLGPALALVQDRTPPRQRATAAALVLFAASAIGLGCGPLAVGIASDHLTPALGAADALRGAIAGLTLVGLWAAAHFALAARGFARTTPAAD